MSKECWVYQAGIVPYEVAWQWQKEFSAKVARSKIPPLLLLLEHPHTYTIGRRGRPEHILWTAEELARRRITLFEVDRGGDVTYHGPGQLVGYPILPLSALGFVRKSANENTLAFDSISFIEQLEQILIRTLKQFEIAAVSRPGMRGVWLSCETTTSPSQAAAWRKIASIGIKLTAEGVSQHGFALNINPQMEYWQGLIPCGIPDCQMTSVAEVLHPLPPPALIRQALIAEFGRTFQLAMVEIAQLPFDTSPKSHYTIA